MKKPILRYLEKFKDRHVLVIGDIIYDRYLWGRVSRISPEAPVPIVKVIKQSLVPGGAANTANNIAALSGHAHMVGLVGNDEKGRMLKEELNRRKIDSSGVLVQATRPTTQKVRIIGHNQQLLRVDYEEIEEIDGRLEGEILGIIKAKLGCVDVIVISDYAKGMVTKGLLKSIISLAKNEKKFVIIDPKKRNMGAFKNADLITPNLQEAMEMSGISDEKQVHAMGQRLVRKMNSNLLITRGENGMILFQKGGKKTEIPTKAKEVYDVSGAGDTVVGTLALAIAAGASLPDASELSNQAAGIVVGKIGTATTTIAEIGACYGSNGKQEA